MASVWECIRYTLTKTIAIIAIATITSSRVKPLRVTGGWLLVAGRRSPVTGLRPLVPGPLHLVPGSGLLELKNLFSFIISK
jgi:hypothetical protein